MKDDRAIVDYQYSLKCDGEAEVDDYGAHGAW